MFEKKEEWIGFFAGLAIAVPWLGRVVPVPSSAVALLFIPVSCGILLLCERERIEFRQTTMLFLLATALYFILVILSISTDQIDFFLLPSEWMVNEKYYYSSKLLKFLLSFFPAVISGLCVALIRDKERALYGLFAAIVAVGVVAVLNVMRFSDILLATSYEVADQYFNETYGLSMHSVVSYGVLFCLAMIASLFFRRIWILACIFLFMNFLLGRRTEVVLCVLVLLTFWLYNSVVYRVSMRSYTLKIFVVFVVAGVFSFFLSNDVSVQRWSGIVDSFKERIDIVHVGLAERNGTISDSAEKPSEPPQSGSQHYSGDGQPDGAGPTSPAQEETTSQELAVFLFGRGLGWYSTLGSANPYPHNILLETWLESGAIAAIALMGLFICSLVVSFRAAAQGQSGLAIFLMIATLVTISMKSGDIASSARLFSFMLISTSFSRPFRQADRKPAPHLEPIKASA